MQIVIDIPEEIYERCRKYILNYGEAVVLEGAVANGTPHETVTEFADRCRECGSSIVGKHVKAVLDKIRTEIEKQEKWLLQAGYTAYNVDIAFDAIKSVIAESEG